MSDHKAKGQRGVDWSSEPLGVEPDRVIAERLGVTPQAVYYARRVRGIASPAKPRRSRCEPVAFAAELGKDHDRVIAERHGLHWQQVAYARRKRGIPGARLDWDQIAPELGTAPDNVIARRYGVDNKVVAEARWRRGVPKWQEQRVCPCGESFTAFHLRQKYCSSSCQRYHWQLVNKNGMAPEAADCGIAVRAYKRSIAKRSRGCGETR